MESYKQFVRSLVGPWKILRSRAKEIYQRTKALFGFLMRVTLSDDFFDEHQAYYLAKALALYEAMTNQSVEIEYRKHYVRVRGVGGDVWVPYHSIHYKGPFTRGYRYIKVNLNDHTYKIIKIKKKKIVRKGADIRDYICD